MRTDRGSREGRWRSTLIVGLLLAAMVLVAKLEVDPGTPRHILTVRKAGYRLEP